VDNERGTGECRPWRLELAEVTSLEGAVRAWLALPPEHRSQATLTLDHAVIVAGVPTTALEGEGIQSLADRLPASANQP
jgi:hypothetical protein